MLQQDTTILTYDEMKGPVAEAQKLYDICQIMGVIYRVLLLKIIGVKKEEIVKAIENSYSEKANLNIDIY